MVFDRQKFKNLVHYICFKCEDPTKLGAIKLNKVLWFADTIAFAEFGQSITGVQYVKQKFGPVPKPILPIIRELVQEGCLRAEDIEFFGHSKRHFVCLTEPSQNLFNDAELKIVDDVLHTITFNHSAQSISDLTHDAAWKLAAVGEEIPHIAALASHLGEINDDDLAWAQKRLEEFKRAA